MQSISLAIFVASDSARKNNKKLGLVNGQIGKVLALNDESVKVDFGNGKIENITSELWEEFSLPNKDGKTSLKL